MSAIVIFFAGVAAGVAVAAWVLEVTRAVRSFLTDGKPVSPQLALPADPEHARSCNCPQCVTSRHGELLAAVDSWNRACDRIPTWKWQQYGMPEVKQ